MCQFIETIQVHDGELQNLVHHTRRMNETRKAVFGVSELLDIRKCIENYPTDGIHKCRIVYDKEIREVSFSPYVMRPVHSLRLVHSDTVDYHYKSTNRKELESLYVLRGNQDDILIVKNHFLTDTSIANVALEKEGAWYTPATPLLKGTKRAWLLEQNLLREYDIPAGDIYSYSRIALFNAMIDFGSLILDINQNTIIHI